VVNASELYRDSDGVWAVAFSPDGHILASSSDEQIVRAMGCPATSISEPCKDIQVGSGQSPSVLMAKPTASARDVSTGQCLRTLQGHRNGCGRSPLALKVLPLPVAVQTEP